MRYVIAIMVATGCWTSAPTPTPQLVAPADPDLPPAIRFALLDGTRVRVFAVVPDRPTLAIERDVEIDGWNFRADSGSHIVIVWAGPSTVAVHRQQQDGTEGIKLVGPHGVARLPEIAWPRVAQPAGTVLGSELGFEQRVFTTDQQAQLVVANCAWRQPDGSEGLGSCTTWQYARAWPRPVAVLDHPPVEDPPPPSLAPIAPDKVTAAVENDGEWNASVNCRDANGQHTLAPPTTGALHVDWLVADPPIFRFDTTSGTDYGPGYTTHRIYEGCARSYRYANAFAGPHGELVLVGHELAVFWHGRLVAHGPGRATLDTDTPRIPSRYDREDEDGNDHPLVIAFAPVVPAANQ